MCFCSFKVFENFIQLWFWASSAWNLSCGSCQNMRVLRDLTTQCPQPMMRFGWRKSMMKVSNVDICARLSWDTKISISLGIWLQAFGAVLSFELVKLGWSKKTKKKGGWGGTAKTFWLTCCLTLERMSERTCDIAQLPECSADTIVYSWIVISYFNNRAYIYIYFSPLLPQSYFRKMDMTLMLATT